MRTRGRTLWDRVQQNPVELSVAFIGVVIGCSRLIIETESLTGFVVWFWATLIVGGVTYVAGRLTDQMNLESAGLALLIGGYVFSGLRRIAASDTLVQIFAYVLLYLALAIGLSIRLWVVRKAARGARTVAANG